MVFFKYLLLLLLPFLTVFNGYSNGSLSLDGSSSILQSEESKESQDKSSCASIESAVNATLAEEEIYKQSCLRKTTYYFYVKSNGTDVIIDGLTTTETMFNELKEILKAIKNPATSGMNSYKIIIEVKPYNDGFQVGHIDVELSNHDFKADIRRAYK